MWKYFEKYKSKCIIFPKKKFLVESPVKPIMFLLVLNFWAIKALCSYKLCSYKKKRVFWQNFSYKTYIFPKFESLKPRSGDISLLVFYFWMKLWSSHIVCPKIRFSSSKYSYFLCIFWYKYFRVYACIPKFYSKIIKVVLKKLVKIGGYVALTLHTTATATLHIKKIK